MTTATKGKAPSAAESWSAWLEQLDQLQGERAEISGIGEAQERLQRAKWGIQYWCEKAWNSSLFPGDLDREAMRGDENAQMVRAVVRGEAESGEWSNGALYVLGVLNRSMRAMDYANQSEERRAFIEGMARNISEANAELESAAEQAQALEDARGELDQRLEALESKAPKASASSLAALRKERDAALAERDRIARALDNMTADDSPLALAREAQEAAQGRLDEAEALLAIGETQASEVKTAKTEAEKARRTLEEQQAEHRRQEAARRGLARKLEQADSRLETLNRAYRQALGRVRHADLAALEGEMVEEIERIATQRLLALADIYDDLEKAEPGSSYGPARIEVKLPHLHHHHEADLFNHHGLTIIAHGVDE